MSKLLISIYDWFERHRAVFFLTLLVSVVLCTVFALRISFQENITNFFDSSNDKKNATFENVAVKDKIVVMLHGEDPDSIILAAEMFETEIKVLQDKGLISSITASADEDVINNCASFIYDYLPIFLTDDDYNQLEKKVSCDGIRNSVENIYGLMVSPSGAVVGDVVMRDPLGLGTDMLQKFEQFNPDLEYEIYNGRLFTKDLRTMLMFIQPKNGMGDTGNNDLLVSGIEKAEIKAETSGVHVDCVGGPIVAVYNARQIKEDTATTLSIALVFILLVIFISFNSKWSIPLILAPPIFGALFALAIVWFIQGNISAIAIGAGTVVLGISLSYSIHFVSHFNNISSPKEIIRELAAPLTIGCFTTIGAFAALMFTSSSLLQDLGLFSVFTLVGTTFFSLVFLPHFLKFFKPKRKNRVLNSIERAVEYKYEGNKWVVLPIMAIAFVALFFFQDVKFDGDMSNINYVPEHIAAAETRSAGIFGDESKNVYVVTGNENIVSLTEEYADLKKILDSFNRNGYISNVVTINDFLIPVDVQNDRIDKWNRFWSKHREKTIFRLDSIGQAYGFKENAFERFNNLIADDYSQCNYTEEEIGNIPVIAEWVSSKGKYTSVLSRITIADEYKAKVYDEIDDFPNTAIIDRGYFSSKMVETASEDFNYILLVSSFIVFFALLISYGRIELTLLTFMPMAVSWVIILGFMSMFDIKFNIVNIILATFIFGIGDDFSIFIMDGLLQEYKNGKKVLGAHKTAIFFSAFTALTGMGVLVFAEHPALKSIALISVLGLSVVVLVSYTVQPLLFRLLVTSHTRRGNFPYTFGSIINTLYCFLYFLFGCVFIQLCILILFLFPIKKCSKKLVLHKIIYWFTKIFLKSMVIARIIRDNKINEEYKKPAVIIANHQSFIDILLLLSTTPKIVMVTNNWVWNSPFFGWIIRYADFHHSADGYEMLAERLKVSISEGYSVVIFPEGTRSADCSIQRFHKGAFYLAGLLHLDILPMLIYGAGHISAKKQGFYIKRGTIVLKTMQRIKFGDDSHGLTYQEQAKNLRKWYMEQYAIVDNEYGRTSNDYFRYSLLRNYIYKGPVLEWYMRVKCRIDGYYDLWDRIVPRDAVVTDVGCGYGQMAFMLGLLSPARTILGIDYDSEKIQLAQNSFLCHKSNLRFVCADMCVAEFPKSDAILFNDSLHYVGEQEQYNILRRAAASLSSHGMIVVRDGDASQVALHRKIAKTEVWSTRIIKFNKTSSELCFVDAEWMKNFAQENNLIVRIRQCDRDSSEKLYIFTKKGQ